MFPEKKGPRDRTLSALLYIWTFPSTIAAKHPERTTTVELYPDQDKFEFDQGHVTENQPITMIVLMSERLGT